MGLYLYYILTPALRASDQNRRGAACVKALLQLYKADAPFALTRFIVIFANMAVCLIDNLAISTSVEFYWHERNTRLRCQ